MGWNMHFNCLANAFQLANDLQSYHVMTLLVEAQDY